MDEYLCAHCNDRTSPALWLCPSHAAVGSCTDCGREGQYVEAVTGLCRACFWAEWPDGPTDKPEGSAGPTEPRTDGGNDE